MLTCVFSITSCHDPTNLFIFINIVGSRPSFREIDGAHARQRHRRQAQLDKAIEKASLVRGITKLNILLRYAHPTAQDLEFLNELIRAGIRRSNFRSTSASLAVASLVFDESPGVQFGHRLA
jgi:hypothetical protein